eukprot:CAMPEP_0170426640 /NCGR_PEP_ID=MMETSP0117_2-20130122/38774_1 /TAXON_ID=400756 /ORGANISM="Durinskia baltica, Strain CSIRO CS-38" /LENGTH=45 /DNA_ID= /DNA_START= /DNA_END= /DNA_ORIENTATION=
MSFKSVMTLETGRFLSAAASKDREAPSEAASKPKNETKAAIARAM